jgi:hypothetical protein
MLQPFIDLESVETRDLGHYLLLLPLPFFFFFFLKTRFLYVALAVDQAGPELRDLPVLLELKIWPGGMPQ